jgi:hypothetical protein
MGGYGLSREKKMHVDLISLGTAPFEDSKLHHLIGCGWPCRRYAFTTSLNDPVES